MNILFIAFEYPPLNRGGIFRSRAFARHLPAYGVCPVIITLSPESYEDVLGVSHYDQTLVPDPDEKVIYVKSKKGFSTNKLNRFFSIFFSIHGNETKYWKHNFYIAAGKAVKEHNIKAVFATVPPFGVLPLALRIAKKNNLPLIYDFRDAWSQWRTVPFGTRLHYYINLFYERKYLKSADVIVVTSQQTLNDFKNLHSGLQEDKFVYLPNGFEGELDKWNLHLPDEEQDLVIGYVGSFYYSPQARKQMLKPWWKKKGHRMLQFVPQKQDWLYRSPYFFFKALRALKDESPILASRIKVKFVGKKPYWLQQMISDFDLNGSVELLGEVSHSNAISFLKNCDMLLITSAKRLGGHDYSIAGKTFEYIQAQKPILAFVCEGAQKRVLEQSGQAIICDPDTPIESAKKMIQYAQGKIRLQPDYEFINSLSRQRQSEQLAECFKSIVLNS